MNALVCFKMALTMFHELTLNCSLARSLRWPHSNRAMRFHEIIISEIERDGSAKIQTFC